MRSRFLMLLGAAPAHADELFGGIYVHDVKTPLDKAGLRAAIDVPLGWRGGASAERRCSPMCSVR